MIMKSTIFALAFFSLTFPAFGQGVDPLIGTWKLNLEKSTGTGLPKSWSLTSEPLMSPLGDWPENPENSL
jgi:hypothetical protein